MADEALIRICVVWSDAPRSVREWHLVLSAGSTVEQAVVASGAIETLGVAAARELNLGVWGRKASGDQVLRDQDRVEIYRWLTVDPKVARRERFRKQGARNAGLFATRRPGAKPGY
ncbi:MAG: RnfH family protein [Ramlibacter sp.]|nr:RnfH family protein [Ramlibacter sp.]MBX3660077.1 RnfH family protein [Ramlibacter sp.]MCW5648274.1 RnfH family protein [Ramlibacter sp.]